MIIIIAIAFFIAVYLLWNFIIKNYITEIKLKRYIQKYDVQLQKVSSPAAIKHAVYDSFKHTPYRSLSPNLITENIFQQYKVLIACDACKIDNSHSTREHLNYLNTLKLQDFLDNRIPTAKELVSLTANYTSGINKNKEHNIDKLCKYMAQHNQTAPDISLASEVLDQLESKMTVNRELTDNEIASLADRAIKEKVLKRAFEEFCAKRPECKQAIFKKDEFWREIRSHLYKIDSKSIQCREIDSILNNHQWWEDALIRHMDRRKTESFRENEEFQRLKRETAQMEREARCLNRHW